MARKAKWPPPVYRHSSGQARVYFRGKSFYLGPYGSPEAERAYAALLVRLTGEAAVPYPSRIRPVSAPKVSDVAARFLAHAEATCRPLQYKLYKDALRPLMRLFGETPAADFDDLRLEQVRTALTSGSWMNDAERERRRKHRQPVGWCRAVANAAIRRVRTCWRWAERQKLVPKGSWANLRTLPSLLPNTPGVREGERRRGSTRAELDRVLPCVQPGKRSRPCACMLELQWLTGMRSGEVCIMRPCDLDRESGPTVDGVRVWLYRPAHHKNEGKGKARVVAIGPTAQEVLTPWLEGAAPEQYLFRPQGRDYPYSTASYDTNIRRACERAGAKLIPYSGRHSAKDRVTRAINLEAARAVLGHATTRQTAAYGEPVNADDLDAAARAAARLG